MWFSQSLRNKYGTILYNFTFSYFYVIIKKVRYIQGISQTVVPTLRRVSIYYILYVFYLGSRANTPYLCSVAGNNSCLSRNKRRACAC